MCLTPYTSTGHAYQRACCHIGPGRNSDARDARGSCGDRLPDCRGNDSHHNSYDDHAHGSADINASADGRRRCR